MNTDRLEKLKLHYCQKIREGKQEVERLQAALDELERFDQEAEKIIHPEKDSVTPQTQP